MSINEGATSTYTLALATEPLSSVTITTLTGSELAATPSVLTFTTVILFLVIFPDKIALIVL